MLEVKNPPANAEDTGDMGSIPRSGGSPRGEHGKLHQYSCLENPMDRGTWWTMVHGVAKSQTWLSDWACMHGSPLKIKSSRTMQPLCLDVAAVISSFLQRTTGTGTTSHPATHWWRLREAIFRVNFQVWKMLAGSWHPAPGFVCHISPCWGKQTAGNCRTHLSIAAVWC